MSKLPGSGGDPAGLSWPFVAKAQDMPFRALDLETGC
jgi:hypothetical protein